MSTKANILIVDDEANTLASLARAFRLAGHEATVCDNAGRALDLVKSQPFDMMLSDVVMPGKDGLSLLGDLRKSGHLPAGCDDFRAGEYRDGGARHTPRRRRFPGEAPFHRQASAHRGQRPQV